MDRGPIPKEHLVLNWRPMPKEHPVPRGYPDLDARPLSKRVSVFTEHLLPRDVLSP